MNWFVMVNDGDKWIDGVALHVLLPKGETLYLCLWEGGITYPVIS